MGAKNVKEIEIGYSRLFEDYLSDMLDSVNRMIDSNLNRLPGIKKVSVEDPGDGLCLIFTFTLDDGQKTRKASKIYVDTSALELNAVILEAFFGVNRDDALVMEESLSIREVEKLYPHVYTSLRREYILFSMPHDNGGEFTDQDAIDLMSLADLRIK